MMEAMINAPVGDDVWGEDPTVIALEHTLAARFGKEAGLFCPSGTMCNQIALKTHTQPGHEIICDEYAHIYQYEAGAYAVLSGLSVRLLHGDRGRIEADQIKDYINPNDEHKAPTTLVCIENTANKAGGSVYRLDKVEAIRALCLEHGMGLHLDGARIFNALEVTGDAPEAWGCTVDSISICLSKGLGCPVGSVLLGSRTFIQQARRWRKIFGGGMRQVGFLAAAGLYALEHNIVRIKQDHERAQRLAAVVQSRPWCAELLPVETNIVIFRLAKDRSVPEFLSALETGGLLAIDMGGDLVRLVTHLDLSEQDMDMAEAILHRIP